MNRFEGSFLGASDKISPAAVMECKICWTPYDPADGDDYRQVEPGTPFLALPADWSCPNCSAPKEQFMVLDDPGSFAAADAARLETATARLVADFREIWHSRMRDVPLVNKMLSVEAVGFQIIEGRPLGVLISPWFMNLVLLPADDEDWSDLTPGAKEIITFPSGAYEFLHNVREMTGGYKACSLFSPMSEFKTQAASVEVARAVMLALLIETDETEADPVGDDERSGPLGLVAPDPHSAELSAEPTRRGLITGGLLEGA